MVESIRANGLLQPIAVAQPDPAMARYTLIAGERRWRVYRELATEMAAFREIPALVVGAAKEDTPTLLLQAFAENATRSDLSAGEQAIAIARLREVTGWSYDAIATRLGMSVRRVHRMARIGADPEIAWALAEKRMTQAEAEATVAAGTEAVGEGSARATGASPPAPVDLVDVKVLSVWRATRRRMVSRADLQAAISETCDELHWWPPRTPGRRAA